MTVLVGAPSSTTTGRTSLADAQALRRDINPALSLGGVAIPERHSRRGRTTAAADEQEAGCRFFVTQVVYDVNAAKNLVSDYHYECAAWASTRAVRLHVLGLWVDEDPGVPALAGRRRPALDRERPAHAADPLDTSYEHALTAATELMSYCRTLGVPFGINVESVSIRGSRSKRP